MYWILLGIIFLWVTVWSLKGITFVEYWSGKKIEEYHVTVGMTILAFLAYCIPFLNVSLFITYIIVFIIMASLKPDEYSSGIYIKLSKENRLHQVVEKIIYYLTKEI